MRILSSILLISLLCGTNISKLNAKKECRFAHNYQFQELLNEESMRNQFLNEIVEQEAKFVKELGVDKKTGLCLDNIFLNSKTGLPIKQDKYNIHASTEALHISILTNALDDNQHAQVFYSKDDALKMLEDKALTYTSIIQKFPETLGLFPELTINQNSEIELDYFNNDFIDQNGNAELFWSIYGLTQVLKEKYSEKTSLLNLWNNILFNMLKESHLSFSDHSNHSELVDIMMQLFSRTNKEEKELLQRDLWQHAYNQKVNILESEYEERKFLFVPLIRNSEQREVLEEAEIERTVFMLNDQNRSLNQISNLLLLDQTVGTMWYYHYLYQDASQSKFGSAQTIFNYENNLEESSLSWSHKITPIVALMGGVQKFVEKKLQYEGFLELSQNSLLLSSQSSKIDNRFALPKHNSNQKRTEDFITCRDHTYGNNFAWGVATAAYQVEGAWNEDGKGPNVWDEWCTIPGRIKNGDTGEVADDFYHKYEQDVEIMRSLGISNFRLSLSWSRILPDGTINNINQKGVDFYHKLLDKLIEAGITPFVTLYHWDLPLGLQGDKSKDSWLSAKSQDTFNDYAELCFREFGSKVKYWITFNEIQSFAWTGYGQGNFPPGRCSEYMSPDCATLGGGGDSGREPYIAIHNILLAHAKAVRTYRQKYQKEQGGVIGMTVNTDFGEPFDPNNPDDVMGVNNKIIFEQAYYHDPIFFGKYPDTMVELISDNRLPSFTEEESELIKGSADFVGLNHYTTRYIKYTGIVGRDYKSDGRYQESVTNINGEVIGPQAGAGWLYVYPLGLRKLLNWVDARYDHKPVYVFENGVSCPGETDLPISEAIHDQFRIDFYRDYIQNVEDAIKEDGVDVRGYFAWSLLDNFEWSDGYGTRFGLVYIDYNDNQKRYVKDSAYWYSDWIKQQSYFNKKESLSSNSETISQFLS